MNNKNYPVIFGLMSAFLRVFFLAFLTTSAALADATPRPDLLLANVYENDIDVRQYWVSEKYDGVRAWWDGKQLISRQGNPYSAPAWFTEGFPSHPLDGELWIARNAFEQLVSTVRKDSPVDSEWRQVTYMIFELPNGKGTFTARLSALKEQLKDIQNPHIKLIDQYKVESHSALMKKLNEIVNAGGEGLMLHHANAHYHTGRSNDLLKVKPYQDAEARVIRHLAGKGKFKGLLGSLLVETPDGKQFRIGSGFSTEERKHPPPVGSLVTYKFFGKTRNGIPRFASFLRIRNE
jgi:DNA ligase-1